MIFNFFQTDKALEAARALYADIVVQARQVSFYEEMGVPDSVEGRFEMVTLHMFLVLRQLKNKGPAYAAFAQKLFDVMFKNMDDSLRELGVGDLSVGKKVRALASAFYGRVGAYEAAFDTENTRRNLENALLRNVFDDEAACAYPKGAQQMADYMLRAENRLTQQSVDRFVLGLVSFPVCIKTLPQESV